MTVSRILKVHLWTQVITLRTVFTLFILVSAELHLAPEKDGSVAQVVRG